MAIDSISANVNFGRNNTIPPRSQKEKNQTIVGTAGGAAAGSIATRKFLINSHNCVSKAATLQAKNVSLLSKLTKSTTSFLGKHKLTSWIPKFGSSKVGKALGGVCATGITIAQLFGTGEFVFDNFVK